jgi:hypothetical protein
MVLVTLEASKLRARAVSVAIRCRPNGDRSPIMVTRLALTWRLVNSLNSWLGVPAKSFKAFSKTIL